MVAHRGQKLAVAEAEVLNADGKPVAVAMGTQMLLPGQPASSFI
jgi:acyl-coenzyme A thioesterase PaaI-like protein